MPQRRPCRQQPQCLFPLLISGKVFQTVAGQEDDQLFESHSALNGRSGRCGRGRAGWKPIMLRSMVPAQTAAGFPPYPALAGASRVQGPRARLLGENGTLTPSEGCVGSVIDQRRAVLGWGGTPGNPFRGPCIGAGLVRPGSTVRPSDGSAAAESTPSWRRGKRPIRGPRGRRRSGLAGECQLSAAGHRRAHRAGAKQWHPSLWQARIAIDLPAGILRIVSPFC